MKPDREWLAEVAAELREPTSHSGDVRLGEEVERLLQHLSEVEAATREVDVRCRELAWWTQPVAPPDELTEPARAALRRLREHVPPLPLWYLSFADSDLPEGTQWLGGAYIRAADEAEALTVSHREGCNPGGEVKMVQIPVDAEHNVPEEKIGKLLDREGIDTTSEGVSSWRE